MYTNRLKQFILLSNCLENSKLVFKNEIQTIVISHNSIGLAYIVNVWKLLLHLYKIVEGLYFTAFSLCVLSVCLSVCPALLVNTIPANWMHQFGRGFRLIEISDLGSKVNFAVAQNPFFLHNYLLTFLLYVSALVCFIHLNFGNNGNVNQVFSIQLSIS